MNECFTRSIFPTNQTLQNCYLTGVSTEISGNDSYKCPGMPNISSTQHNNNVSPGRMMFFRISVPVAVALTRHTLALSSAAWPWSPQSLNTTVHNTNRLLVYCKGWFHYFHCSKSYCLVSHNIWHGLHQCNCLRPKVWVSDEYDEYEYDL